MRIFRASVPVGAALLFGACQAQIVDDEDEADPATRAGPEMLSPAPAPAGAGGASGSRVDAGMSADVRAPADSGVPTPPAGGVMADAGTALPLYRPDPVTLGANLPRVVPVLWVEVAGAKLSPDVKVPGTLKIFEQPDPALADLATRTPTLTAKIGFGGRGNFTWTLPKKPYAIEVRDDGGMDLDVALLGMPKGSDWALYACYTDKTCMRNALVYAIAQELGRWSPRARYVELFLDGQYQGLYMLIERVRRDKERVPLPKVAPNAVAGDLSGGYIFRHEGSGKGGINDWTAVSGIKYTYHYPRADEITPEQKAYLKTVVDRMEAALKAPADYAAAIDLPSWVDYAIVQELTNNWDGYARSVYYEKLPDAAGGRVVMAPLWDYDLAFGNGGVTFTNNGVMSANYSCRTDAWGYQIGRPGADAVPPYWARLHADPAFRQAMRCRWNELRKGPLSQAALDAKIAAWTAFTADARKRDQQKWPTIGKMIFPNCWSKPTYDDEVAALRTWIADRFRWLDANLPGTCGPQ